MNDKIVDMFEDAPVPIEAQIESVAREIKMRERVYPRWVDSENMSLAKANNELRAMRAVLDTLLAVKQESDE